MENLVHAKNQTGSVNLKKQEVMKAAGQEPANDRNKRPEELANIYLGYINGRMAHFMLKYIPSSNQYVKVEV